MITITLPLFIPHHRYITLDSWRGIPAEDSEGVIGVELRKFSVFFFFFFYSRTEVRLGERLFGTPMVGRYDVASRRIALHVVSTDHSHL
jgi:hypothetical protein